VTVIFAVRAIRHAVNPMQVGPAGGINAFEGPTDFLGLIVVVVAAMIGVTAGAGDAELGLLRDLIATGARATTNSIRRSNVRALRRRRMLGPWWRSVRPIRAG
jgi:hypothetical protein